MVDVSDLNQLLQRRARATAAQQVSSRGLKSEELRSATPVAPARAVPVAEHPFQHLHRQLSADEEIAAHRAKYARFFTMLRVGIPRETVEQAMRLAGVDPVELDGPHLVVDTDTNTAAQPEVAVSATGSPEDAVGPGPGSGGLSHLGRKKALRKRLYWDVKMHNPSLGDDISGSSSQSAWVWRPSPSSSAQLVVSDATKAQLEQLFVKETIDALPSTTTPLGRHKQRRATRISLLETKKAQNIGITLARVKLSLPQLVRELVNMNPTVLCAAQLQGLLDMWPDRKELEALDEFSGGDGDPALLLGKAEQFFLETRGVPRFRERLECLIFKQEFPSRVHELR